MIESAWKEGRPFDYVFIDEVMPVMSGSEAISILRFKGYKKFLITVTGNALDEDVTKILSLGADRVLRKPLRVQDVESLFNELEGDNAFTSKDK
jgi:CheY-like chemotaxis protein